MTDRIEQIRARALRTRHTGDSEAGAIITESRAQSEGEPEVIRIARDSAAYAHNQRITIRPGELIVGAPPGLTADPEIITPQIFGRREWTAPTAFWPCPSETHPFWEKGLLAPAGNHTTLDYTTVFAIGFQGLIARVDERLARLAPDEEDYARKRDFLTALRIVAEGHIDLSSRYAEAAEAEAADEQDPARREELLTIAANCRRVPAQPPTTFWEACQCAWFSFFFLADAPGRVDQYLNPCYETDIQAGRITREFAKELLSCLWAKYFEIVGAPSGVSAHNHLTLGGVTPDGRDASNIVTELGLEVTGELGLLRPQVGLRWNPDTPRPLLRKAVETLRTGAGNPDFCSDAQIVQALHRVGVSLEDARDFSLSGCHEVIVTGKAQMGSVEGFVNMSKLLHMALGLEPDLYQPAPLTDIADFDMLWNRIEDAMAVVANAAHLSSLGRDEAAAKDPGGHLQASLVVGDCIENCLGYTQGGARYNFCNWDVIGTANLVDSLAVIRQLVFEEQSLTLAERPPALRQRANRRRRPRRSCRRALRHDLQTLQAFPGRAVHPRHDRRR